jgi:transposase
MEPVVEPVGVDVSKATLDVACSFGWPPPTTRMPNQKEAFPRVLEWMQARARGPLHVCLEATGTYHDAFVAFLLARDIRVSVLPSNRLKAFRESEGIRSKTDKLDAILLARYCQHKHPAPFVPLPDELTCVRELLGRLRDLETMERQERNRAGNARLEEHDRVQLGEHIQLLSRWGGEQKKRIRAFLKEHEDLKRAIKLLRSIPGIGERTSWHLVALLGADASRFPSARHLVLYVGLDVARRDSGKRRAGQISKRGPAALRGCLGMAAIVAKRWDPDMQRWAAELTGRGKKSRQVRVAIMRKLLHLAYGVLTSQQAYDPRRGWPTHLHPAPKENLAA